MKTSPTSPPDDTSAQPAVTISQLTIRYKNTLAVDNVSLSVGAGQVVALLGPNGAGKSTMLSAITGQVQTESGSIRIFGRTVSEARSLGHIAFVPQSEQIDWDFPVTVRDVVMMGRYGHLGFTRRPQAVDHDTVNRALAQLGIRALERRQIGQLSGGQRKRVFIARAVATGARLLLLDEPFTGVDKNSHVTIVDLLREWASGGRSIIIATHGADDVRALCDRAVVLQQQLLFDGPTEQALTQYFSAPGTVPQ